MDHAGGRGTGKGGRLSAQDPWLKWTDRTVFIRHDPAAHRGHGEVAVGLKMVPGDAVVAMGLWIGLGEGHVVTGLWMGRVEGEIGVGL